MRKDSVGFFWDDTPPPKPEKVVIKRTPPKPTWLEPDYLPGLEEAQAFPVQFMSPEEVQFAALAGQWLIVDVECFKNYFLVLFTNAITGKVMFTESSNGLYLDALTWIMNNTVTVGFNSNNYDLAMISAALAGLTPGELKRLSDRIIKDDIDGREALKEIKLKYQSFNSIDLIEVAPLMGSLKVYAGRMHAKKMQDLPFPDDVLLSQDQISIVRWYCFNDTANTLQLMGTLKEQLELRYSMSQQYGIDLRSKSDAQIAEAVIRKELAALTGRHPKRPTILPGTTFRYKVPHFIKFQTPNMQYALEQVAASDFVVDKNGSVIMPEIFKSLAIPFDGAEYRMGIGGLHSSEKTVSHYSDMEYQLVDRDVTSYYPRIILNQGLYPQHLGPDFLRVYGSIVERRIKAKEAGRTVEAESLKIVVNGSFGKLGSMYSILYAPDLLIQVTLTGQLSLMMLIEMLALAGIRVVSANTDGIVIKSRKCDLFKLERVVEQWEIATGFNTEETRYLSVHSRDVNNYIAVKQKYDKTTNEWLDVADGTKTKGAYANPWASTKNPATRLHKNPTCTICVEAVEAYLTKGTPVEETIRGSNDITKFVTVRTVRDGAVKVWDAEDDTRNEYLGKVIRWYYGKECPGELVYASSGNRVPRGDGAVPCMVLPDVFPNDVDDNWYIAEAKSILEDIGVMPMGTE